MNQILYISDSMKQSVNFINDLILDLQKLGIENIEHNRENNFVTVGEIRVNGIAIYENCLCLKIHNPKYFIDGIDMRNYRDTSKERLDSLIWHIKDVMLHFREDTEQLSGKDELIKILTEG